MKVIVKRFWVYFLATIIVIGSIGVANFSAMAEVANKYRTDYAIDVAYNQDYTTAVLQGNIQTVKEGVELLSLKNQEGETFDPNNFSKSVSENGTYTFFLTYHRIDEDQSQHEHTGHEDHTEEITVKVDQIAKQASVVQFKNGMQLSNYTIADFENARAVDDTIRDIPDKKITFKGYQIATYKDKVQNPSHEELVTINMSQANQTKFDNYMQNTGLPSGYISEDSMSGLSLTGLTFDSLTTVIGDETHRVVYIMKEGNDIFYLTDKMESSNKTQSTVLAQAGVGQEFQIRYRAVDQREVTLNLNRTTAENLGVTFEINGREPKWSDGTPMDTVYITSETIVSIEATYPNKYNQASVTIDRHATPQNVNQNAVFNANKLTKLFVFQIASADQIGNQTLSVQWNFQDTRPTDGRLIALVDAAEHPAGSKNNSAMYCGTTRLARLSGSSSGNVETFLNLKALTTNGNYVFSPTWFGGPFSGVISGPYANGATFDPSDGSHGMPLGNTTQSTTPPAGFTRDKFTPYNIKLWNSATGGQLHTFNNISGSTGTNLNDSNGVYSQSTGVFQTTINGQQKAMFLGSYTGNAEQVFEYDFEWGAPHNRYIFNYLRYGEYPNMVLRYDTYAPDAHMVYTNGSNQPQNNVEPVYTEYLLMPTFPDKMSDLVTQNGINVNNYDGRQLPVNTEVTHTTSDGATVKIKLKSMGMSNLEITSYRPNKMDLVTVPKIYKYEITVTNPTRDIRLSISSDSQEPGYQGNTIITKGNISGLNIGGTEVSGTSAQVTDAGLKANCTHGGNASTVTLDGQASVDGTSGNYGAISVAVPQGYGNVTASIMQNGSQIDPKYLQLCHISSEVDPNTNETVTHYHYHYFGKQIGGSYARLITFDVASLYSVDIKYQQTENNAQGFISGTEVVNRNFLKGTPNDNSQVLIGEIFPPNVPANFYFSGWKLSLIDITNNRYMTTNGSETYVFKDGKNGTTPFVGGDMLDLAWLYDQMDVNNYLKTYYSPNPSPIKFEVRAVPVFVPAHDFGTTMKIGETQFFYQGSLGTVNKNIDQDTYSRFKGEKETRVVPNNSTVICMSTKNELPALQRFVSDMANSSNRYAPVKFRYNPALSITNNNDIPAGETPDTAGYRVTGQLFYDRVFNVRYAKDEMTNSGISMNGIQENIGEYTLATGNGSVVTLDASLVNNSSIAQWKIKELVDANIDHTITVTNGAIDLSTLSSTAKNKLLEMDSANKNASYTTVTLSAVPPTPLQIVDQSTDDVLWIKGENPANKLFIWADLVSAYSDSTNIRQNISCILVHVRNGQKTEYPFGVATNSGVIESPNSTPNQKIMRIMMTVNQNFPEIQDGDQFYIKLSLINDANTFVTTEDHPITARVVNLMDSSLVAGIDGMVSMPANITLADQNDGSLASSMQDITLNPFEHPANNKSDYNWIDSFNANTKVYKSINVQITNPLVTLISSRNNANRFEAQVQNAAGQDLTPNASLGRFIYGTSEVSDHLLQYKVVGPKPIGASRGEIYTGTLTFQFITSSN